MVSGDIFGPHKSNQPMPLFCIWEQYSQCFSGWHSKVLFLELGDRKRLTVRGVMTPSPLSVAHIQMPTCGNGLRGAGLKKESKKKRRQKKKPVEPSCLGC
jgi:hypothetical protein